MHRFEEDDNEEYLCPSTRYLAVLILILCFIPFTAVFIVSAGETFNYRIVAIALSVYFLVARAFFCLINSSCCSNCCLDELEEDAELLVEVVID